MPTLRSICLSKPYESIRSSVNVREASVMMAKEGKGILVIDCDELVGIITPKDILNRVVAKAKSPDLTAVFSVMTSNPECVHPDITLLEALQEMHERKYLHLPVRDYDGTILGLVDAMQLITSSAGVEGGGKGWRAFFNSAINARGDDDQEDSFDSESIASSFHSKSKPAMAASILSTKSKIEIPELRASIPLRVPDFESISIVSGSAPPATPPVIKSNVPKNNSMYSIHSTGDNHDTASIMYRKDYNFKLTDHLGKSHRVKCSAESYESFKNTIASQIGVDPQQLVIKYQDDDNDEILIDSDTSLSSAVDFAITSGVNILKIKTMIDEGKTPKATELFVPSSAISTSINVPSAHSASVVSSSRGESESTGMPKDKDKDKSGGVVALPSPPNDLSSWLPMITTIVVTIGAIGFGFLRFRK